MADSGVTLDIYAATTLAGESGGLGCSVLGEGPLSLGVVLPLALLVGWLMSRLVPEGP